ncbi:MAG: DNA polymerase I [Longimicrobiales bacterium]
MVDMPPKKAPRLFLIDAYALIYRAFFAFINRPLTNSRGENTSAPFGFANFLLSIRENHQPDYLAVVFDKGMSQREEMYAEYKATREKMPDELEASLPRIHELVEGFHDEAVAVDGYEADDVIGTLALKARDAGLEAVIVSGDKDLYQLVGPGIHLLNPGRGGPTGVESEWVDETNAHEKFGIPPEQITDYLALVGDSSDNVPGAPGIGPKTAVKLLREFGNLEEILARAPEMKAKRVRESLTENADLVRLSKKLVTIQTDVPVELELDALRVREPDRERLRQLFVELEFRRLTERFTGPAPVEGSGPGGAHMGDIHAETEALDYRLVTDPDSVVGLARRAREVGFISVDTETTSQEATQAELVGISLSFRSGEAFYLPFGHRRSGELALDDGGEGTPKNLPPLLSAEMRPLVEVLEDPAVAKIGQNLKYDLIVLEGAGVTLRRVVFDTMVASYVLDPNRRQHGLDALSLTLLGHKMISYEDVAGKGKAQLSFAEVSLEKAREYACEDADFTLRLKELFEPQLREHELDGLFRELEIPLVPVLARMEANGIRIDVPFFREMNGRLEADLEGLRKEIVGLAGEEFNLNSTPQLREILFDKLGLPVLKKTKTGPSTDASVLEELAELGHALPTRLLEYRQLEKLRNTYVDALPRLVNPGTGRIHTSFNQTVAATGRLSSSDPNLQNIPIRTELGREIRKGFVAEEGFLFFGADYSQIELRILAHFSGDESFVKAFQEGIDVHKQTASVIFGVPLEEVTPEMRGRAKTINFATLYGQGDFSLGRQLGISREEARDFIHAYFERFSGVRTFLDDQVGLARDRGYVETLSGRRRYVPEMTASNWNVRQFGERIAQNTPIQGTAADLIKMAMIRIQRVLEDRFPRSRLLLQVHDELLLEVPEDDVEDVGRMVVEEMEGAMELNVPLAVDTGTGDSWYACKG